MSQEHGDGKETNAGGGHIDLPGSDVEKAVHKEAPHPGAAGNAAGMDASPETKALADHSKKAQPQMPDTQAGTTLSHASDG